MVLPTHHYDHPDNGSLLQQQQQQHLFPLESLDDNLLSDDQLYDRKSQGKALLKAFRRRTLTKPVHAELILLHGSSGCGKTALAQAFGRHIVCNHQQQKPKGGGGVIFMAAKFPLVTTGTTGAAARQPCLTPLHQALQQFAHHVATVETKETRDTMRDIGQTVVGSEEWMLLLNTFPCLDRLWGNTTTTTNSRGSYTNSNNNNNNNMFYTDLDSSENTTTTTTTNGPRLLGVITTPLLVSGLVRHQQQQQQQPNSELLVIILRRFFRAMTRAGGSSRRDIVLFLDDLQWADSFSLSLIRTLVSPSIDNHQGLMVIGSCRGNEVAKDHFLAEFLRNLEDIGTRITEIVLDNLSFMSLSQMITDVVTSLPQDQRDAVTKMTYHHTNGNPFFVHQYLRQLEQSHALYMDANRGVWVWREHLAPQGLLLLLVHDTNANHHHQRHNNNNQQQHDSCVLPYLVERMKQLPLEMQEVLMAAACLGGEIRETFLWWALGCGSSRQNQITKALQLGREQGFWEYDFARGLGKFSHDRFLEGALELIPKSNLASFQLRLGRNLQLHSRDIPGTPKALPTFIHLIRSAKAEIVSDPERAELASLCLEAAKRMAKSSAFAEAIEHVVDGINLLSENHWEDHYELSISLYNAAAELSFCNGDHDGVDQFVTAVANHVKIFEDGLQAETTGILSLGSRGLNGKAVLLGMRVLRKLGESVPSRVTRLGAKLEVFKTRRLLRGKSDEDILEMPKMRNGRAIAVMSILHVLYPIALMSHIEYTVVIACRLICLTLHHGLCSYSTYAYQNV
jgi:predicted ATPase